MLLQVVPRFDSTLNLTCVLPIGRTGRKRFKPVPRSTQRRAKRTNQESPRGARLPCNPRPASRTERQGGADGFTDVFERTAKLFATPTPPRSPSSRLRCGRDLSYRGRSRASPSPEKHSRATMQQFDELCYKASAAQDRDEPGVVSSLLLEALKLAPVRIGAARRPQLATQLPVYVSMVGLLELGHLQRCAACNFATGKH